MSTALLKVSLAETSDSESLKMYYQNQSLKGLVDFEQDFKKSFFSLYDFLSDEHYTFKMGSSDLQGSISFVVKEVVLE
nr:hypothetical protein [Pseudobdellovibrionaceae bacterium]